MPSLRSNAVQGRRPATSRKNETRKTDKRNFNKAQREILEEFFQRKKFALSQKDLQQLFEQCEAVDQRRQFVTTDRIKTWMKEKRKEVKQSKLNAPKEQERDQEVEDEAMEEDQEVDPEMDPAEDPEMDPAEDPEMDPAEDPEMDPAEDPEMDPAEDPEMDPAEDPEMDPAAAPAKDQAAEPAADPEVASTVDNCRPQEGTSTQEYPRESSTETFTGSISTVTSEQLDFTAAQRRCLERFFKTKQSDLTEEDLKELKKKCLLVDSQREYATVERIQAWFAEKRRTAVRSVSIPPPRPYKPIVLEPAEGLQGVIKEDPMAATMAARVATGRTAPEVPAVAPAVPAVAPVIPETADGLSGVIKEDPMAALLADRAANARPEVSAAQNPDGAAPEDAMMALLEQELLQDTGAPVDPEDILDAEALLNEDLPLDPDAHQDPENANPAAPEDAMEEDPVMDQVNQVPDARQDLRDDEAPGEEAPQVEAPETIELVMDEDRGIQEDSVMEQEAEDREDARDQNPVVPIQDAMDQDPAAHIQDAFDEDLEAHREGRMDQDPAAALQDAMDEDQVVDPAAPIQDVGGQDLEMDPENSMEENPAAPIQDAMDQDPVTPLQDLVDMDQGSEEDPDMDQPDAYSEVDLNATIREDPEDYEDFIDDRLTPAASLTPFSPVIISDECQIPRTKTVKELKSADRRIHYPPRIIVEDGQKTFDFYDETGDQVLGSPVEDDYELVEVRYYEHTGGYHARSLSPPSPVCPEKDGKKEKLPPPPKKPPVEMRNAKTQEDIYVKKPVAIYKEEEKAEVDDELKKRVNAIDFDKVVRTRVWLYGEGFRKVYLPFSNSLDYRNWSENETFEFFCQFLPLNILTVIQKFKLDGSTLGSFWSHKNFKLMNATHKLMSYEDFYRLGIKMWETWEAVDERQSCIYIEEQLIEREETLPELHFPFNFLSGNYIELEENDEQTQTDGELYIETHVDKSDPLDNRVTVGLQTRNVKDLRMENVRNYGRAYRYAYLPFNGEIDMKKWTRVDVAEFCCQFLPLPAVRAIWDHRISGYFLPHLAKEPKFYCALNMTKVVITHFDFLIMLREIKRVRVLYKDRANGEH